MASKPKAPKPKTDKALAAETGDNSTPRPADQDLDRPAADAAAAADQAAAPAAGSVAESAATTPLVDGNAQLDDEVIIVKSKSVLGRRRAGFAFTREEARLRLADLSDDQINAIYDDPELVVKTIDEVKAG